MDSEKSKLHQHQIRELRDAFDLFDKDGDGRITSDELMCVMTSLRQKVTEAEIREMIGNVDIDGVGSISFPEFVDVASRVLLRRTPAAPKEMQQAFDIFDTDGDGFVVDADIRRTMAALGEDVSDDDVRQMIREADTDKDGRINYSEFVAMMQMRISNSMHALDGDAALSDEQRAELRMVFSLFDKDSDQNISLYEVIEVMRTLGQDVDEQRLQENFDRVDLDGNGLIDFSEFVRLLDRGAGRRCAAAEMRALFSALDRDRNGHVDASELRSAMAGVGVTLTDDDVKQMLREAGDSSRIYYEDFVKLMTGVIGQNASFTLDDSLDATSLCENGDSIESQEAKIAFAMFDKDGDGVITCSELLQVMTSLGIDIDSEEVRAIVRKVDLDENGVIEFDEFDLWMRRHRQAAGVSSGGGELSQLFRIFDKDCDGCISALDLRNTMKDLGLVLTRDDVAAMMKEVGLGPNGKIFYEDFRKIMGPLMNINVPEETDHKPHNDCDLRVMFSEFDADRDGRVGLDEARRILNSLGYSVSNGAMKSTFSKVDVNGNGLINFNEFLRLAENIMKRHTKDPHASAHVHADHVAAVNSTDIPDGPFYPSSSDLTSLDNTSVTDDIDDLPLHTDDDNAVSLDIGGRSTSAQCKELTCAHAQPEEACSKSIRSIPEPEIWRVFKQFDHDRNGYISNSELRRATLTLGINFTDDELMAVMREADTNKDGKIDYREFNKLIHLNDAIKQAVGIDSVTSVPGGITQEREVTSHVASRVHCEQPPPLSGARSPANCATALPTDGQANSRMPLHNRTEHKKAAGVRLRVEHVNEHESPTSSGIQKSPKKKQESVQKSQQSSLKPTRLSPTPSANQPKKGAKSKGEKDGGNGSVEFNEFLQMMRQARDGRRTGHEMEMWTAFKVFDIDGNGLIDASELRQTMQNLGEDLSDSDLNAMIYAADRNKDGKIDYEEFIRMMFAQKAD